MMKLGRIASPDEYWRPLFKFWATPAMTAPYLLINDRIMQTDLEAIVIDFIRTVESRKTADELHRFFHPDMEQTEFPNAVTKTKTVRTMRDSKSTADKGSKILAKERYEIINTYTIGNKVIIEAEWTGTLAIPVGNIPAGGEMKAYFAQFYEFEGDKIFRIRNYDCFEPFA
jgi:ketosteroid isomerase-like protein